MGDKCKLHFKVTYIIHNFNIMKKTLSILDSQKLTFARQFIVSKELFSSIISEN